MRSWKVWVTRAYRGVVHETLESLFVPEGGSCPLARAGYAAHAAGTMFRAVHPILGTRNLERALAFYTEQLGFELAFRDPSAPDNYAGVRREHVELHLQWQDEQEMSKIRLRFIVDDPDRLHEAYGALRIQGPLRSTPWGTREFALYDPDGNSLTFYRDLSAEELGRTSRSQ